jgi:hypothetical protein
VPVIERQSRKATKQYLGEESNDEIDADERELLESLPDLTLISSLLHKYACRLREV